jgi:cytochrome oxidase Cu insertion factor (SCO1/SenC/PrrC family)
MKQKRIVTIPILSLIVWILFLQKYVEANKEEVCYGIVFNKRAPDFTLTSQNGTRVTLSQFRGNCYS